MYFYGPRTQILLQESAENESIAVYTVPENKIFNLISAALETDGGAVGTVKGCIRDENDVVQVTFGSIKIGATTLVFPSSPFSPNWPIELIEGWDLCVSSSAASLIATLNIFGYEVDV
jgi:hypothetical protein